MRGSSKLDKNVLIKVAKLGKTGRGIFLSKDGTTTVIVCIFSKTFVKEVNESSYKYGARGDMVPHGPQAA